MKKTKITNALIAGILMFVGIIAGCSRVSTTTEMQNYGLTPGDPTPSFGILIGFTEFYFKPAGDDRVWHVVNKYYPIGSTEGPEYNMASYTITSDSVFLINEIVGIPESDHWDISLSSLSLNNINNKQN